MTYNPENLLQSETYPENNRRLPSLPISNLPRFLYRMVNGRLSKWQQFPA
jgi:hypothetical protein